jgi:DNA-binding protein H-NS
MIDRHCDRISGTAKRTSERRISAPSLEKFSGGITPSQTVPATSEHYAQGSTIIVPSTLPEDVMRKLRDFDGELKALQDKARDLKNRKVQRLGELVIATGADTLTADELAGALILLAETKDTRKMEAWAKRGAAFFQGRSRRNAPATDRDTDGAPSQPGGGQPPSGGTGAT